MVYGLYFLSGAVRDLHRQRPAELPARRGRSSSSSSSSRTTSGALLTQVGTGPLFSPRDRMAQGQSVEELVRAVAHLAGRRVGALIVLQNEVGLNEYIDVGTRLDARVSRELVTSIFLPRLADPRRRAHHPERAHHRRGLLPAAHHEPERVEDARHAPPRRDRPHRGDRRHGHRRVGRGRHDLARARGQASPATSTPATLRTTLQRLLVE